MRPTHPSDSPSAPGAAPRSLTAAVPDGAVPRRMPASLSPAWGAGVRLLCMAALFPYMRAAYCIRGWGRLPFRRGPTLVVSNHVHDLDIVTMALHLFLAGPWRHPVFVATSRRLFEPGFMATRAPRLTRWLSRSDWSGLFRLIGLLPIENELRERPIASLAWWAYGAHGDLAVGDVFDDAAAGSLGDGAAGLRLADLWNHAVFRRAQTRVGMDALRPPYRREARLYALREIEADLGRMQDALRCGGTLHITPEGACTPDGGLLPIRGVLGRLAPFGRVYLAPISYDPFLGRRLAILYRVIRPPELGDLVTALKAARPVTVSQLLAAWLVRRDPGEPFHLADAAEAVAAQVRALPPRAFVAPPLRRRPEHAARAALTALVRLGLAQAADRRYTLTDRRAHPKFPWVRDMIGHQARFFAETCDALAAQPDRGDPA